MDKIVINNTYTFRRNIDIGSLDAESDHLLLKAFVDKGDISLLEDVTNPKCILLGRTGAGKSALIRHLENNQQNVTRIAPESISLRHLSNSTIIKYFRDLDVRLDLFYKVLWKHVFIVELIKLYFNNDLTKSKGILQWVKDKFPGQKRKKAVEYLENWEDKFWADTEYRIKELETSLENRFKNEMGASSGLKDVFNFNFKDDVEENSKETVKYEVISKAQKVVNDSQIEQINEIIKMMKEELFDKKQQKFFIIIDDLDKEWVANTIVYDLIRALIDTIKELSDIPNVKIIIALRANIHKKIFNENTARGLQREKYGNLFLDINWTKNDLKLLLNNRLRELMKHAFTNQTPTIDDILSLNKKQNAGLEYLVEHSLMRPRDIIDFFNKCIKHADGKTKINMEIIKFAEDEYSNERLRALDDEWNENFGDMPVLYGFLRKSKAQFKYSELMENIGDYFINAITTNVIDKLSSHLKEKFVAFGQSFSTEPLFKEILIILYEVGILGIKISPDKKIEYVYSSHNSILEDDISSETKFYIHPMFHKALRVSA